MASPGILFCKIMAMKIAITERCTSPPFRSVLFIKHIFKSELLFIQLLECREHNNFAICLALKKMGEKKYNLYVSSIYIGKIICWNQLHTSVFEKQHDSICCKVCQTAHHYLVPLCCWVFWIEIRTFCS